MLFPFKSLRSSSLHPPDFPSLCLGLVHFPVSSLSLSLHTATLNRLALPNEPGQLCLQLKADEDSALLSPPTRWAWEAN